MKIIINNVTYNDILWNDNGFSIKTNMSLNDVEKAFTPGTNTNIIVFNEEQEIARYYNKGINSLTVTGNNPRIITVTFNLTQIANNAEIEIRSKLNDTDGAIIELAKIIGELSELDIMGMTAILQNHQNSIDTLFTSVKDIVNFIDQLRQEGGILEQYNAHITALEHEVGIISIVRNNKSENNNG